MNMDRARIYLSIGAADKAFGELEAKLSEVADVTVGDLADTDLGGYDIYIGKKLSRTMLETADRLRAVFAYKTGVEDFPLDELYERGIMLVNSHADADYIAEYAFGMAISLVNRITEFDKKLRRGIWYDADRPYWRSFFDMKVGLVGYGHIGRQLHSLLLRNGMDVYTIDRGHEYSDITPLPSLEELCRTCDLLVLSLPATRETDKLMNADMLSLLGDKYIVNVGRSNCMDQGALYEALVNKTIGGVANDTWDRKPQNIREKLFPSDYNFGELENIVLSPHQAMRVNDGHARYVEDIGNKVLAYLKDGSISDVVDLKKGY